MDPQEHKWHNPMEGSVDCLENGVGVGFTEEGAH
jgi:hypothetical protein